MFQRLRAILGVIWSGGRVAVDTDCPYCSATHRGENARAYSHTDYRAKLSKTGRVVCRSCGRPLYHSECDACGTGLPTTEDTS